MMKLVPSIKILKQYSISARKDKYIHKIEWDWEIDAFIWEYSLWYNGIPYQLWKDEQTNNKELAIHFGRKKIRSLLHAAT